MQGWGGEALLASYEQERRPLHERTINEAVMNYATVGNQLVRPALEAEGAEGNAVRNATGAAILATKAREFSTLGLVLGARYDGSPILVPDGTEPPPEHIADYLPTACPGGRAPHLWLPDGSSLFDHFGQGFTLLATQEVEGTDRLLGVAAQVGIPLKLLALEDARLRDLYEARFALIRPDQHVAWRGNRIPDAAGALLRHVVGMA